MFLDNIEKKEVENINIGSDHEDSPNNKKDSSTTTTVPPNGQVVDLNNTSHKSGNEEKTTEIKKESGQNLAEGYAEKAVETYYSPEQKKLADVEIKDNNAIASYLGINAPELEDDSKKQRTQKWLALNDGMHLLTRMVFASQGKENGNFSERVDIGGTYDNIGNISKEIEDIQNRNSQRTNEHARYLDKLKEKLIEQKSSDYQEAYKRKKDEDDRNTVKYSTQEVVSDTTYAGMSEEEKQNYIKNSQGGYVRKSSSSISQNDTYAGYKMQGGGHHIFAKKDNHKAQELVATLLNKGGEISKKINGLINSISTESGSPLHPQDNFSGEALSRIFGSLTSDTRFSQIFYDTCKQLGFPVSNAAEQPTQTTNMQDDQKEERKANL